jgi:hypothetical protein
VLWDHRNNAYHNRDMVDKEWDNVSQAVAITSRYKHRFNYFILCSLLCARVYTEYFVYVYMITCTIQHFLQPELASRTQDIHVSSSTCEFKESFRPRTLDACNTASNSRTNDHNELEWIYEEATVVLLWHYPWIFLEWLANSRCPGPTFDSSAFRIRQPAWQKPC